MKKIILSLLAALALVGGLSTIAEAKTNFNLYLGVPYYDYQVGPDYLYDENHGWYQQDYRQDSQQGYQQDYQQGYQPAYHTGGGPQRLVCLVTFFRRDQVRAGADANVQRAQLLPLRVAQRLDRPNDRNRIFVYGRNQRTRQTCRYLAGLNNRDQGNNQELVCLVTFFSRDQVSGGADADVQRAQLLPRRIAESMDGPNDRNRIFVYGSNQKTRQTCRYLDGLNNQDQGDNQDQGGNQDPGSNPERVCLVTFFTRDQVSGGADANVERARVLPRRVAESMDGPDDRNRIFVYGSNQKTEETCRYLNGINN